MKRWRPVGDEEGQGTVVLILVIVVVAVTVFFLLRTLLLGISIDEKAEKIAQTGRGINSATDAILQLDRTEGFGRTIHESTEPLEGKVNIIVGQAQSIDNTATSINNSANSIGGSANSIGGAVASIQSLARLVDRDARLINENVSGTRVVGSRISSALDTVNAELTETEAQASRICGVLGC